MFNIYIYEQSNDYIWINNYLNPSYNKIQKLTKSDPLYKVDITKNKHKQRIERTREMPLSKSKEEQKKNKVKKDSKPLNGKAQNGACQKLTDYSTIYRKSFKVFL